MNYVSKDHLQDEWVKIVSGSLCRSESAVSFIINIFSDNYVALVKQLIFFKYLRADYPASRATFDLPRKMGKSIFLGTSKAALLAGYGQTGTDKMK